MAQLHVFDTDAKSSSRRMMHLDVILAEQNQQQPIEDAKNWLDSIGKANAQVSQGNSLFYHSTSATLDIQEEVNQRGYAIFKLEGCPVQ